MCLASSWHGCIPRAVRPDARAALGRVAGFGVCILALSLLLLPPVDPVELEQAEEGGAEPDGNRIPVELGLGRPGSLLGALGKRTTRGEAAEAVSAPMMRTCRHDPGLVGGVHGDACHLE